MVTLFASASSGGATRLFDSPQNLESLGLSNTVRLDSGETPVWRFDQASNNVVDFAHGQVRNDDLFAQEQLTFVETRVAEQKFAPLMAQSAFATVSKGGWNNEVKHFSYEQFGRAAQICCANDFPRVSIDGREIKTPLITIGTGFEVCLADLRKGNEAGIDVAARMMNAGRRSLEQALNDYAWNGDSKTGIMGVGNNPMFGAINSPFRLDDLSVDPFLVLAILNQSVTQPWCQSATAMPRANAVAVAPCLKRVLETRLLGQFNTASIWETFIKQSGITKVTEVPQLECLHGNQRTMFFYNSMEENMSWNVPLAMEVLPAVQNGYGYAVNMIARVGSVWSDYPRHAMKLIG